MSHQLMDDRRYLVPPKVAPATNYHPQGPATGRHRRRRPDSSGPFQIPSPSWLPAADETRHGLPGMATNAVLAPTKCPQAAARLSCPPLLLLPPLLPASPATGLLCCCRPPLLLPPVLLPSPLLLPPLTAASPDCCPLCCCPLCC